MQTGLFFGSFDPIHQGHLAIARFMKEHAGLDQVWFVISPQSPFKKDILLTADHHRLHMVELAVANEPGIRACDIEFGMPVPNYTVYTLEKLRIMHPEHHFSIIMGSDNPEGFNRWKDYEEILSKHPLLVYHRPGYQPVALEHHTQVHWFNAPLMDISATAIRELLRNGADTGDLLKPEVLAYIREQGLYLSRQA